MDASEPGQACLAGFYVSDTTVFAASVAASVAPGGSTTIATETVATETVATEKNSSDKQPFANYPRPILGVECDLSGCSTRVDNISSSDSKSPDSSAPQAGGSPDSARAPVIPGLRIIGRAEHGISRQQISPNSLKVLYKLNDAGFQAYIVGGGVRDILLGLHPKDFDIATDATPEETKALFRNSRIIGRRFRIVHVQFGREIIEVSTFRALQTDNVATVEGGGLSRRESQLDAVHSTSGMILRDNVFGSMEEDVLRRDFTVNALYYTVRNFEVHDYVNGMADIDLRTLRMIGDPEQRYREDPVRILRALRLAAKLNFRLAPETEAPLHSCAALLESVPPARLFDEYLKLFFSGHGESVLELLEQHGVFHILFPAARTTPGQDGEQLRRLIRLGCASTDARINEEKSVTPAFLLSVMLWPAVKARGELLETEGQSPLQAMHEAGNEVLGEQLQRISIPRRFSMPMREIWDLQVRLTNRRGKRAELLLEHKRFRAAYDFLLLREASGENLEGLGQWWTEFQEANPQRQGELQEAIQGRATHSRNQRRRTRSRRRKPATQNSDDS